MTERKNLFRRVFDAMVERRTSEAQRHIADYLRRRPPVTSRWL
ncbi:MAG: hypothetical protein ACO1OG_12685 [Devosia sp.]